MKLIIDIDEEQYEFIKQSMTIDKVKDYHALLYDICERIKNGISQETVTEFADRCKECGTRYIRKSVVEDIKAEIKSLMKEQETHFDVLEVGANRAFLRTLSIINRHIREGRMNDIYKE